MPSDSLHEPARRTPVAADVDVCVIGGSCTGVFAAARAARLGCRVALVEQNILFGGMATAAQVNEWHSLHDMTRQRQIIGGLTDEVLANLRQRGAVQTAERKHRGEYFLFNSAEMVLELDQLVRAHSAIRPFLKAGCVGAIREGDRLVAALIEDKSGRRAIRARVFIDASGDGDLLRRSGFAARQETVMQPVSYQMVAQGLEGHIGPLWDAVQQAAADTGYPRENSRPWINSHGAGGGLNNVYGPRLNGVDASDADQLTAAILESRRCHRILLDTARDRLGRKAAAVSLAHALGVRETWHAECRHRITRDELLHGVDYADCIAVGTYPVDVHSPEGTLLRHLDGWEERVSKQDGLQLSRWRDEGEPFPAYYQIPYRALQPREAANLLVAGRLLDADREAYGGLRVMVNMNQTGEAAGTAAALAVHKRVEPAAVDTGALRDAMAKHGSIVA